MRLLVFRNDPNGNERWTEVRLPEPLDAARIVVTVDGEDVDYGDIAAIDETWEPRG